MCPALAQADDEAVWQTQRLPATGEQYSRVIAPPAQVNAPGQPADAHAGEPQVTLSGDGRVYVNAFEGRSWRSDDGGRTFQEIAAWGLHTPAARHTTTQDVDVAFSDPEQGEAPANAEPRRVVHSLTHNQLNGSSLVYTRSFASKAAEGRVPVGEDWQDVQVLAPAIDRPYIATSGSNVYISYTDYTVVGRRQLWFRTSSRNGDLGSFGPPVDVFASADPAEQLDRMECFNRHGEFVVVERPGLAPLLHIPYTSGGPDCDASARSEALTEYRIATSADGGTTWTHQVVPRSDSTGGLGFVFPSLAGSADGTLYAVWAERPFATADEPQLVATVDKPRPGRVLRLQVLTDGTWLPEPARLEVPGQTDAVLPTAVAGKHGVDLLWYSARDCPTTKCWVTMHAGVKHLDHARQSVTLRQVSPGDVHHGEVCTDGFTCAPLQIQDQSSNRFREFLGLARGADGTLYATWNSTLDRSKDRNEDYPVAVYYGRLDPE